MLDYQSSRLFAVTTTAALLLVACGQSEESANRPAGIGSTHSIQIERAEKAELSAVATQNAQGPSKIGTAVHPFASPAYYTANMGRELPAPKKMASPPSRGRLQTPGHHQHDNSPARTITVKPRVEPTPSFQTAATSLVDNGTGQPSFTEQCDVNFNDEWALSNSYRQARGNFGVPTTMLPDFTLAECDPATTEACWIYKQRCGTGFYVNVEEPSEDPANGHIHLSFENFIGVTPCFVDPGDGLQAGYGYPQPDGSCLAAEWEKEPRLIYAHTNAARIRVWLKEWFSEDPRQFNAVSITIAGDRPASMWIKRAGEWYEWESVEPGVVNLSMWAWEITDLYLGTADNNGGPAAFDDLVITR